MMSSLEFCTQSQVDTAPAEPMNRGATLLVMNSPAPLEWICCVLANLASMTLKPSAAAFKDEATVPNDCACSVQNHLFDKLPQPTSHQGHLQLVREPIKQEVNECIIGKGATQVYLCIAYTSKERFRAWSATTTSTMVVVLKSRMI